MSVVGTLEGAVGGCGESEADVVDLLVVRVVRICGRRCRQYGRMVGGRIGVVRF